MLQRGRVEMVVNTRLEITVLSYLHGDSAEELVETHVR